jgi:5-methylcytosine-specific restriction endonuclease McrA
MRSLVETEIWLSRLREKNLRSPNRDRENLYKSQLRKFQERKRISDNRKRFSGAFVFSEWRRLRNMAFKAYGRKCLSCGALENLHIDHIKPKSKFPELALCFDNLQVLCGPCNSRKGNRTEQDFRRGMNIANSPEQSRAEGSWSRVGSAAFPSPLIHLSTAIINISQGITGITQ